MSFRKILFCEDGNPIDPDEISNKINNFGYNNTVSRIIQDSQELDSNGEIFVKCTAHVLCNFGMTRSGPFKGVEIKENGEILGKEILLNCWKTAGDQILKINHAVLDSGYSRDRYLLDLDSTEREVLIANIWSITKSLFPFTMGKTSYGLVGASKILFAVLPGIVLPVDNSQWLNVFKTVDLGDVIREMIFDIQCWESLTGRKLNERDPKQRLTTLPSVYNVMAMAARP